MAHNFLKLDGKVVSDSVKIGLVAAVREFQKKWQRPPGLHVILVGEDPASQIYVGHKEKAAQAAGFISKIWRMPAHTKQQELEKLVQSLVHDTTVDGILVQMPLPTGLDSEKILALIPVEKDVDGFSENAVGALALNRPQAVACTPAGVMEILKHYKISTEGLEAVVVGRSNIVGRPMALLLINAGATVTVCHSKTKNMESHLKRADLVVVAAGKAQFLKATDFKPGAVVVDVGIHRTVEGKVVGDVNPEGLEQVVRAATPVPGGVGPMTIAMLLKNTLNLAQARMENS